MTNKPNPTRTRLLDAAQSLMMQNGFHSVTVDSIVAAASISKGSFFYHFDSKDDLPAALLQRFIDEQGQQIQAVLAASSSPPMSPLARALLLTDQIKPIFALHCHTEPGCMMAAFAYQLMQHFPALRTISQAALSGWKKALTPVFSPLCAERTDVSGEDLAMQLMDILQGSSVVARIENSTTAIDVAVKHFKLYLTLLANSPKA